MTLAQAPEEPSALGDLVDPGADALLEAGCREDAEKRSAFVMQATEPMGTLVADLHR